MDLYCCDTQGCMKAYKSKVNLKRHKEAFHSDSKKYQCPDCSKILSSNQNLREHMLIHSQETPFVCKIQGCGKKFRHGSQFSAHKRVHGLDGKLDKTNMKILKVELITRLLCRLKDSRPYFYTDLEEDQGLLLPALGTPQYCTLPNVFRSD